MFEDPETELVHQHLAQLTDEADTNTTDDDGNHQGCQIDSPNNK